MKLINLLEYDLQYKKNLNSKLWKDGNLIDEVKNKLLQISQEFIKSIKIDNSFITDIQITGSNCNYNWNNDSDIDLHVILSYSEFAKSCSNIDIESMFKNQKTAWNDSHDIRIYDIPVECYVEDSDKDQNHDNKAKYSLMNNSWINEPQFIKNLEVDGAQIDKQYNSFKSLIEDNIRKTDLEILQNLAKSLAEMRQKSLETEGEFGVGNLAYKKLRKSGILKSLWDRINKLETKKLSLK